MPLYGEGIFWYLLALDCVIYNFLSWTQGKFHEKKNHWLSPYLSLNKAGGLLYLLFLLWVGSALWRLDILLFR